MVVQDGGSTKKSLTLSMPILIGNIPLRPVDASYSDGSVAGPTIPSSLGNDSNNQKLKASSIADYPNLRNNATFYQDNYCLSFDLLMVKLIWCYSSAEVRAGSWFSHNWCLVKYYYYFKIRNLCYLIRDFPAKSWNN